MTGLGLALLWSVGTGLVWVAALGLSLGACTDPVTPDPDPIASCDELGADLHYPPSCTTEGCSFDGEACSVMACSEGVGLVHGSDGRVGCDQTLCTIDYGGKQTLCDQGGTRSLLTSSGPGTLTQHKPLGESVKGEP